MLRHESEDMDLVENPEIQRCWDMNPETWILQRILRYKDAETWIRRHGSCRGSWDKKMLRHKSGDMDLAEDREIQMNAATWIRRPGSCRESMRYKDAETWIRRHGSCRESVRYKDAETWIRRRGSCRGSWDTHGCWDMKPETWILQRSLRHKDTETWIRRCGSCRGSILVDATTWIGDMAPAEDLEIRSVQKTQTYCLVNVNHFHAICRGGSYWEADVKDPLLMSSYTLFGVACRYN